MLGAQALRTKQKVDQKKKEKRQRNIELQRERIQRAANEDARAAMFEYAAAAGAAGIANSSASTSNYDDERSNKALNENEILAEKAEEFAQYFHQLTVGSKSGYLSDWESRKSMGGAVNRKIHQRYSLHHNLMPLSARESMFFDRTQVPKRSPSSDDGKMTKIDSGQTNNNRRSSRLGSISNQPSGNRFLRWFGLGSSNTLPTTAATNSTDPKKYSNIDRQKHQDNKKRRMSTY